MSKSRQVLNFEDTRFARVTRSVLDDEKFLRKPTHKLVYAILCMYASNNSTKSYPSVKTIANKCGCSENTVRLSLKRLEECELIGITRRKSGKENISNEYELYVPPEWFLSGNEVPTSTTGAPTSQIEE